MWQKWHAYLRINWKTFSCIQFLSYQRVNEVLCGIKRPAQLSSKVIIKKDGKWHSLSWKTRGSVWVIWCPDVYRLLCISRAWPWPITLRSFRRTNIVTLPESLSLLSWGVFEKELVVSMSDMLWLLRSSSIRTGLTRWCFSMKTAWMKETRTWKDLLGAISLQISAGIC